MLLNHTEEEIPDRKTSEAAKWLSDNNVQFDTPTFWLVAGLLNAYGAERERVERERCAERLMSECRQFNEEATRACKHGNYELRDKLEMKANLCERLAAEIEGLATSSSIQSLPISGNPSCHVCGAVMYERGKWGGKHLRGDERGRVWDCQACGASTEPTRVAAKDGGMR